MLIDTNIFLEVFLDQDRATECLNFQDKAERGEVQGFMTDSTAHSLAVVLERAGMSHVSPDLFDSLSAFQGLNLLHASLQEHSEIAHLATSMGLDFDDAYQAYFALG